MTALEMLRKIYENAGALVDSAHPKDQPCDGDNPTCENGIHTYLEVDNVTLQEIMDVIEREEVNGKHN